MDSGASSDVEQSRSEGPKVPHSQLDSDSDHINTNPESANHNERQPSDDVLETLLSDKLLSEFDPRYWISTERDADQAENFTEKVFPLLGKYFLGTQLDELINGYEWLSDLLVSSKRHKSARAFQGDPAQNLAILDVFIKLSFINIWGSRMMQYDPICCVCYELLKIVEDEGPELINQPLQARPRLHPLPIVSDTTSSSEERAMFKEFGNAWTNFGLEKMQPYWAKTQDADIDPRICPWYVTAVGGLGRPLASQWLRNAMRMFLNNSTNPSNYGKVSGGVEAVVSCWEKIKQYETERHSGFIVDELWEKWGNIIQHIGGKTIDYRGDRTRWANFTDGIWSFCLAAGCPRADRSDPFASVESLRDLVSRQFAYTTDLHNKISELNKRIILQQRMITALAYRNVLENVSATTPGINATDKWHNFLERMFREVEDENGVIPAANPFNDLFDQHDIEKKYTLERLIPMAKGLYSSLSRTIHYFQPSGDFDQYTPMPGQFDQMEIDFMSGMRPENVDKNREPNWEHERGRYPGTLGIHDNLPKTKPEEQPEAADGGDQPVDNTLVSNDIKEQSKPKKLKRASKAERRKLRLEQRQETGSGVGSSSALQDVVLRHDPDLNDLDVQGPEPSGEGPNVIFGQTSESEDEVEDKDEGGANSEDESKGK